MRRTLRILAGLGLVALLAVAVRRFLAGRADTAPPAAPWEPLQRGDVVQPAPTTETDPEPATVDTATGPRPGSVEPLASDDSGPPSADTASDTAGMGGPVDADSAEPNADGSCPAAFPVKAKLSSKIFHVPGGGSYERTKADRCYLNEAAAVADGLRQAKR